MGAPQHGARRRRRRSAYDRIRHTSVTHRVEHELVGGGAFQLCRDVASLPLRGERTLRLDLGSVAEIDASGVVALVRIMNGCAAAGVPVELVDVAGAVRQRLQRTQLTRVVRFVQRDAATAAADYRLARAQSG